MTLPMESGQDPALPAMQPLLVRPQRVPHGGPVERAGQAVAQPVEQIVDALAETRLRATPLRDGGHGAQAQHDRLTVWQVVVALDLQRVTQGVTEVERPSLVRLERVAVHDTQLEPHGAFHHRVAGGLVGRRAVIGAQCGLATGLEQRPQPGIADDGRLEHLGEAVELELAGERPERRHIPDDRHRRPEGPRRVLGRRQVDRDLAADGGIGLGEPGGGHPDERHSPEIQRRGRAHQVPGGAAPDRDPGIPTFGTHPGGGLQQPLHGAHPLAVFPGRDPDRPLPRECGHEPRERLGRALVAHDHGHARRQARDQRRQGRGVEVTAVDDARLAGAHRVVTSRPGVEQAPRGGSAVAHGVHDGRGHGPCGTGRLDAGVCRRIERLPRGPQAPEPGEGIAGHHRASHVGVLQPARETVIGCIEPDHGPGVPQRPAAQGVDDRAAARGDDGTRDRDRACHLRRLDLVGTAPRRHAR